MKCPSCGHWNRASFPRCFRCGAVLPAQKPAPAPVEEPAVEKTVRPDTPTVIRVDEFGVESVQTDKLDKLALEMLSLQERKRRGEIKQKQLRSLGAERGFAPSGASVAATPRRNRFFTDPQAMRKRQEELLADEPQVDYDGFTEQPSYYSIAGDEPGYYQGGTNGSIGSLSLPVKKRNRMGAFTRKRLLPYLAVALLLLAGIYPLYRYVISPWLANRNQEVTVPQPIISASILDDMAAHTIAIPAPEGSQIYIKELRKSYIVAGGYATFQIADYFWYELIDNLAEPSMDVEITPYIRTASGEQKQMDVVRYTINIPLSPITLISPDVTRLEVSTPVYNIRFHVMQNSKVYINGEDYSSFVNTQNGFISYNADVQPVGDNLINISVRSQYYRENTVSINIYRAVQDIPLDLASTLTDRSSNPTMTISATTRAGAQVTILSPYHNMDDSQLASTGAFKFDAVFNRIGTNTVIIRADYPGRTATTVEYDVYYLPDPDHYTPKAWALDEKYGYADLLGNLPTRVRNTQIYVMTGPVLRVVSTKPQLVIIDCADGRTSTPLEVMVENQTKTQWQVGERYRLYADTSGSYGGIPRLTARYTYKPKD